MNRLILAVLLLLPCFFGNAQSQREKVLLNQDWRFAKGHTADPEKDFNYGRALSFSKIAFLQESTMLNADQESRMQVPLITPIEKCCFYLGVVVPKETIRKQQLGIIQIPDERYAVFQHTGSYASLHKFYQLIYEEWFPKNEYRPKSTFSFEVYLNNPRTTKFSELITEIYIPIEKI